MAMTMTLHPFTSADGQRFQQIIAGTARIRRSPLSALALAPHLLWAHVFAYRWAVVEGWFCLFAEYSDGQFMPLPPMGPVQHCPGPDSWKSYPDVLHHVFQLLEEWNQGTAVSRIENIPEELKQDFEDAGCAIVMKDPDYLYCTEELMALTGNRYKSPRAGYNHFVRCYAPTFAPYQDRDHRDCLALLTLWRQQKEQALCETDNQDAPARWMLQDAEQAHRTALENPEALGLLGRVARVDGKVVGYTFGYERTPDVFCIALEVTDRSLPGAGAYVFREFCREMNQYEWINTMDDSCLPKLARAKRAYRPSRMVSNYVATVPLKG